MRGGTTRVGRAGGQDGEWQDDGDVAGMAEGVGGVRREPLQDGW
jgi:hypothetical protein